MLPFNLLHYSLVTVLLNYSAVKGFDIYDLSSLISVHSNSIDSIYAVHLGGIVV